MRSYPSCWNKVLTQLNFRRKRRKPSKRRNYLSRRSLFENLEQRQMLSGDPLSDLSSEETVVAAGIPQEKFIAFSRQPEFFLIEKEYTAEELDGTPTEEIQPLFVVQTRQTKSGPKAIISFNPDSAGTLPTSLQKVQLELRQNGRVLESYDILIDIAEESFREQFLADRVKAVSVDVDRVDLRGKSEWFTDSYTEASEKSAVGSEVKALRNFIGPLTISCTKKGYPGKSIAVRK